MKKEDLSSVLGGIALLVLIYVFWFTPAKDKFKWWQKMLIGMGVVGTVSSIGYALGKEDTSEGVTEAVVVE